MKKLIDSATEDDILFFYKLLWIGIMDSERMLFSQSSLETCPEYCRLKLQQRRKCFEWLEDVDPNEETLKEIVSKYLTKVEHEQA